MANKQNKVMAAGSFKKSLSDSARENFLAVRAKAFRGVDILVKQNRALLDSGFTLEVDAEGSPSAESHQHLQRQVQMLLQANFKPKSDPKADLGWGVATWSTSQAARDAGLDPTVKFEVGLCVAKTPDPARAQRVLDLISCGEEIQGVRLEPSKLGHLDIPAASLLGHPGLVVVSRGGAELELTSFSNALLKARKAAWAKPTAAERAELKAAKEAEAAEAAEAKAAEAAFAVFGEVMAEREAAERAEAERAEAERAEAERLEAERLEAELLARRAQEWADIVTARPDIVEAWEALREEGNHAWEEALPGVNMVLGLVRPGTPAREAVAVLLDQHPDYVQGFAKWVKETHAERAAMTMAECISLFMHSDAIVGMEGLFPTLAWFIDGHPIPQLAELGEYATHEQWEKAMRDWPAFLPEQVDEILGVADSE